MNSPRIENGIVVGTGSNKYQTKNPIARRAIEQLLTSVVSMATLTQPKTILEVGCGEGQVTRRLLSSTDATIHATDISSALVAEAKATVGENPRARFSLLDIYNLNAESYRSDTVVCCEVLEHLENPQEGLRRLAAVAKYAVLSVPREPNFRVLNFLRGQHVRNLGNAPGHLQHWSSRGFIRFVEAEFDIVEYQALLPWTVVLAKPKRSAQRP